MLTRHGNSLFAKKTGQRELVQVTSFDAETEPGGLEKKNVFFHIWAGVIQSDFAAGAETMLRRNPSSSKTEWRSSEFLFAVCAFGSVTKERKRYESLCKNIWNCGFSSSP